MNYTEKLEAHIQAMHKLIDELRSKQTTSTLINGELYRVRTSLFGCCILQKRRATVRGLRWVDVRFDEESQLAKGFLI